MQIDLSQQDVNNIREALYLAADSIEDIDDMAHYESTDLQSIVREAAEYRSIACRLSEYDSLHSTETGSATGFVSIYLSTIIVFLLVVGIPLFLFVRDVSHSIQAGL